MTRTAIGLFASQDEAQHVVDMLAQAGFSQSEITVVSDRETDNAQELLSSLRIPDNDLAFYQDGITQGDVLVSVRADARRAEEAARIIRQAGTVDIDARVEQYRTAGRTDIQPSTLDEEGMVIPVLAEDLAVGKRQVQRGGVRIHSYVTETPVEEQVTLREERVQVERRPVDRPVTPSDTAFTDQSFELTETAEEVVVNKQARVVEEIVVDKDVQERTETVRDTVRRTEVDIQQVGADTTQTRDTTGYKTLEREYRSYYERNLADSGYSYEQYQPVFQYGHDLTSDARYQGRSWTEIEGDARSSWEASNPNTWDRFKDSIRYAWERATGKR